VVGGYRFSFVAKRPTFQRFLFFRFALRIELIGEIRETQSKDSDGSLAR